MKQMERDTANGIALDFLAITSSLCTSLTLRYVGSSKHDASQIPIRPVFLGGLLALRCF